MRYRHPVEIETLLLARKRSSLRIAIAFIISNETYKTVPRPKNAILGKTNNIGRRMSAT